jgi:hypothetical protein
MAAWTLRFSVDSLRRPDVLATRSRRPRSDLVDWQLRHLLRHPADRTGLPSQGAGKPIGARGNAGGSTPVVIFGRSGCDTQSRFDYEEDSAAKPQPRTSCKDYSPQRRRVHRGFFYSSFSASSVVVRKKSPLALRRAQDERLST